VTRDNSICKELTALLYDFLQVKPFISGFFSEIVATSRTLYRRGEKGKGEGVKEEERNA
jgi:hypothetical protein